MSSGLEWCHLPLIYDWDVHPPFDTPYKPLQWWKLWAQRKQTLMLVVVLASRDFCHIYCSVRVPRSVSAHGELLLPFITICNFLPFTLISRVVGCLKCPTWQTYLGQSTLMSSSAPTWNFLCTRSRAAGNHRLPSVSPHGFPKCPMRGTAENSPLRGHRLLISRSHATEPLQPTTGSALTSPTRIHLHTDSSVIEDGPLVGLKKWALWADPARAHSDGTVQPPTPSSSPACVCAQRIIPLKPTHTSTAWKTAWLACSSGFAKVCARLGHLVSQAIFTS